jgi:hypothetical protein
VVLREGPERPTLESLLGTISRRILQRGQFFPQFLRDYVKQSQAEYEAKMTAKQEQLVRRKASALGFELVPKVAPGVT